MEIVQEIYNEVKTLKDSLLNNKNKANDLRKLYERLYKSLLGFDSTETQHTLHDMINDYAAKENKQNLQYICHSLRKNLNTWSHDNPKKLSNEELDEYFIKFNNIILSLTGIDIKEDKTTIKNFLLTDLELNEKQEKAVLSTSKITLVSAGPGTDSWQSSK